MQPTITHCDRDSVFSFRRKATKHVQHMAVLLSMLSQVAFTDLSYADSRVFFDDFESGNLNSYVVNSVPPRWITTGCHSGTKCVSVNWNGAVAWNDPSSVTGFYLKSFPYNTQVFTRFWMKVDPDFDFSPSATGGGAKIFKWGFYTPNEIYLALGVDVGGKLREFSNSSINLDSFWGSPQSSMGDHNWHKVEQYMTTGNSGTIRLWVDGVQVMTWSGNTAVGGTWYPLGWGSNWSGAPGCCSHDANNHLYIDDFEIFSDSNSGTSATESMANRTIHASSTPSTPISVSAPSNLHVVP